MDDRIGPVCGISFIPAVYHAYRTSDHRRIPVCSWSCQCESERNKVDRRKGPRSLRVDNPILQLDKEGNLLRRWPSIDEAARVLRIDPYAVTLCCTGQRRITFGCAWKFEKEVVR